MRSVVLASFLSLGVVAGCGGAKHDAGPRRLEAQYHGDDCISSFARDTSQQPDKPRLRAAAVPNYNKGYVDGVHAAAFFNQGKPLGDEQAKKLIEISRRQGDPGGLLALEGYPDGYRAGARHAANPYAKQMTAEQTAQVGKSLGLPQETVATRNTAPRREQRNARREAKDTAEASVRD
jgi:hypothetical protein